MIEHQAQLHRAFAQFRFKLVEFGEGFDLLALDQVQILQGVAPVPQQRLRDGARIRCAGIGDLIQQLIDRRRTGCGGGQLLLAAEALDADVNDAALALRNAPVQAGFGRQLLADIAKQAPVLLANPSKGEDLFRILAQSRHGFELGVQAILGRPQFAQFIGNAEHCLAQGFVFACHRLQRFGLAFKIDDDLPGAIQFVVHVGLFPRIHASAKTGYLGLGLVDFATQHAQLRGRDRLAGRQAEDFLFVSFDARRQVLAHGVVLDLAGIDQQLRRLQRQ